MSVLTLPDFIKNPSLTPIRFFPWVLCAGVAVMGLRLSQMRGHVFSEFSIAPSTVNAASDLPRLGKDEAPPALSPQTQSAGGHPVPLQPEGAQKRLHQQGQLMPIDLFNLTPQDMQILGSLNQKRLAIAEREEALRKREEYLVVVESRVDRKIEDLKGIQAILKRAVAGRERQEDQQLKSLVKIYEVMKPQDAATILSGVELEVLLSVMERMREQKASAILAAMQPFVSQRITLELAERLRINRQLMQNPAP